MTLNVKAHSEWPFFIQIKLKATLTTLQELG